MERPLEHKAGQNVANVAPGDDEFGDAPETLVRTVLLAPFRITLALVNRAWILIRPFAPQLVPLLICLVLVPFAVLFSVSAGWFVWRSVAVGWETDVYLQYGDGSSPYAQFQLPLLGAKQPYDISLDLLVPMSEANLALGNFMTSLTLSTLSNKTITTVRRPAIVISPHLSFLSTKSGTVGVMVPLLKDFVSGHTSVMAKLDIGRRDGWKSLANGEGRELSVVSASLRGVIRHRGVRGLVTRFPLFFSAVSSVAFLAIALLMLATCILPAIPWSPYRTEHKTESRPTTPGKKPKREVTDTPLEDSGDEKVARTRRRSSTSRASVTRRRSSTGLIKNEVPEIVMPVAESSTTPLRRRSRLSEAGDS